MRQQLNTSRRADVRPRPIPAPSSEEDNPVSLRMIIPDKVFTDSDERRRCGLLENLCLTIGWLGSWDSGREHLFARGFSSASSTGTGSKPRAENIGYKTKGAGLLFLTGNRIRRSGSVSVTSTGSQPSVLLIVTDR